jgi:hypothetical protein
VRLRPPERRLVVRTVAAAAVLAALVATVALVC